ncbi:MAG TPA: YajQ family cyclic di-GMP-binding protein [Gammaproteobacteria bacterium]|nr:YajQ family cyclic di-GMP-binding protein [Gammaproteobacteria bacterium]
MPSFDVVSEVNAHELANAVDQANREINARFDFKGTNTRIEQTEKVLTIRAPAEFQVKQALDILQHRLTKRGIDLACLKIDPVIVSGSEARQVITVREGIDAELARKISRQIKDSKLKVQSQIQGPQVRVSGKKRDDLQAVIALLRTAKFDLPLQYTNFRD